MLVLALFAFVQINVVQVGPYQHAGATCVAINISPLLLQGNV